MSIERHKKLHHKVTQHFKYQMRSHNSQWVKEEQREENRLQVRILEDNCPPDRYEEK